MVITHIHLVFDNHTPFAYGAQGLETEKIGDKKKKPKVTEPCRFRPGMSASSRENVRPGFHFQGYDYDHPHSSGSPSSPFIKPQLVDNNRFADDVQRKIHIKRPPREAEAASADPIYRTAMRLDECQQDISRYHISTTTVSRYSVCGGDGHHAIGSVVDTGMSRLF